MGLIDIIKPFSTLLSNALNKLQQHQEKKSWECQESNLGPLGAQQERYPLCFEAPNYQFILYSSLQITPEREWPVNHFYG